MTTLTKFDICNRALTGRVGASAITSFDDGTAESIAAGREYEALVQEKLSEHRWNFAKAQAPLNRLDATPDARWAYAFQLPGDMLVLHAITRDDVPVRYDRYGDKAYTDEDADLVADYTWRVPESRWPAYFVAGITVSLAAVFAVGLNRDLELAKALRDQAEVSKPGQPSLWAKARTMDAQQQTTRRIAGSRLVSVRR